MFLRRPVGHHEHEKMHEKNINRPVGHHEPRKHVKKMIFLTCFCDAQWGITDTKKHMKKMLIAQWGITNRENTLKKCEIVQWGIIDIEIHSRKFIFYSLTTFRTWRKLFFFLLKSELKLFLSRDGNYFWN